MANPNMQPNEVQTPEQHFMPEFVTATVPYIGEIMITEGHSSDEDPGYPEYATEYPRHILR